MLRVKVMKAQSSIEFMILTGAVLFFFIGFLVYLQSNVSEKEHERVNAALRDVVLDVQDEINLAAQSSEGYHRDFTIPPDVLGKNYSIIVLNGTIYANTLDGTAALSLPVEQLNGALKIGTNTLRKIGSIIYLN